MSAAIAADNVVVALYFAMLFSLAKGEEKGVDESSSDDEDLEVDLRDPEDVTGDGTGMTMPSLAMSMAVASCLVTIGKLLTTAFFPTTSVSSTTNLYSFAN